MAPKKVILKWLRPSIHRLHTCPEYIHRLDVLNTYIKYTHGITSKMFKNAKYVFFGTYIGSETCYMQLFASRNRSSIVPSLENIQNT